MSYIILGTDLGISRLQTDRKLLQIISSVRFSFKLGEKKHLSKSVIEQKCEDGCKVHIKNT